MRIEVKDLIYSYGQAKALKNQALSGVNLNVEEGEFFGIIGHTGSGKTTFIQHLNGLIRLNKNCGKIQVGKFDLGDKKCDFKALRASVGMVFQYPEHQLFAETIKDDVAFGVRNFMPEKSEDEVEQMVKDAILTVGLNYDRIKDKSPFDLSGGQKRRVAIAGVIVTKPEVLVLDEPVAGLDPVGKRDFLALLKKLHNTFVKTIILVTHDMDIVSEYCTKVAIFNKGKIYSVGTPKEVFTHYDEMSALGLDLPLTARLMHALDGAETAVDSELMVDEFVDAVAKKYARGNE